MMRPPPVVAINDDPTAHGKNIGRTIQHIRSDMLIKEPHVEVNPLISLCFTICGVKQKGRALLNEMGVIMDTRPFDEIQWSSGIHQQ